MPNSSTDQLPIVDAHRFVGISPAATRVRELIRRLSGKSVTTLIQGDTGTGKEIVALLLHRNSPRAAAPLVAVNCAAIPEAMVEGELFGYARGAFTGANRSYPGKFGLADGGTLFLDEVGELSLAAQAKILRAIESRQISPLGALHPRRIDVRIIAATNRDLCREAEQGRFRTDLLFRLDVVRVHIPPLAGRREDVAPLTDHLLAQLAQESGVAVPRVSAEMYQQLASHHWRGNVRELRNALEHALVVACNPAQLEVADLPDHFSAAGQGLIELGGAGSQEDTPEVVSRDVLLSAIAACGGCRSAAARMLHLPRTSFYRYLHRFSIPTATS